jgi:hypothetical protein
VRAALLRAKRADLIGDHPQCLIPEAPPLKAIVARRQNAKRQMEEQKEGDHIRGRPGKPAERKVVRKKKAGGKKVADRNAHDEKPRGRTQGDKSSGSRPAPTSGSQEGYRPHRRTSRRRPSG